MLGDFLTPLPVYSIGSVPEFFRYNGWYGGIGIGDPLTLVQMDLPFCPIVDCLRFISAVPSFVLRVG